MNPHVSAASSDALAHVKRIRDAVVDDARARELELPRTWEAIAA